MLMNAGTPAAPDAAAARHAERPASAWQRLRDWPERFGRHHQPGVQTGFQGTSIALSLALDSTLYEIAS
jgi:hypothetical protein